MLPVVHITLSDHEIQYLSFVIADQVQFESIELSHGAFAPLGNPLENLVYVYSLVAAHTQKCAVNETHAFAFPQKTLIYENNTWYNHWFLQFSKAVEGYSLWKEVSVFAAYLFHIEVFKAFMVGTVEHYHNDYNLCIRHAVGAVMVTYPNRAYIHQTSPV